MQFPRPQLAVLETQLLAFSPCCPEKGGKLLPKAIPPGPAKGGGPPMEVVELSFLSSCSFSHNNCRSAAWGRREVNPSPMLRSASRFIEDEACPGAEELNWFGEPNRLGGSSRTKLVRFLHASRGSQALSNFALQPSPGAVGVLAQVLA